MNSPADIQSPRTEAGRVLVEAFCSPDPRKWPDGTPAGLARSIRAIEEQAATEARAEAIQGQLEDISDIIAEKVAEAGRELLAKPVMGAVKSLVDEAVAASRRELLAKVRTIEWVQPMSNSSPSCPACGAMDHWGHEQGCWLAALMEESR